jgi:transposase
LNIEISAANDHDSIYFIDLLDKISLKGVRGRPRTRPDEVNADPAYDSDEIRSYLRRRGIKSNIPVNRRNRKFPKRGRPPRFDEKSYKNRGAVERFNAWIESFKRILVRFERLAICFMAAVNLACIRMVLRVLK